MNIDGLQSFGLINLPFLLHSGEQADTLLDRPFGQKLLAKLPDKGLVGLAFWENGFRQVTNNRRAIEAAKDFSGLKLRVIQNPLFIETFSAIGASAQPMPFPEVYTALETGVVDGQENPLATILASKFYEVQDYTVMSNHIYSVWALLMGKKFWDKLSSDEQQLIMAAAKEATPAYERETIRAFFEQCQGTARERGHADHGIARRRGGKAARDHEAGVGPVHRAVRCGGGSGDDDCVEIGSHPRPRPINRGMAKYEVVAS